MATPGLAFSLKISATISLSRGAKYEFLPRSTSHHGRASCQDRPRGAADATGLRQTDVKRGKIDAADAEAVCEEVARPTMRLGSVKSLELQPALSMHRTRDLLFKQR